MPSSPSHSVSRVSAADQARSGSTLSLSLRVVQGAEHGWYVENGEGRVFAGPYLFRADAVAALARTARAYWGTA